MQSTGVLNLLSDPWLPVIHRSGRASRVSLSGITLDYGSDPIVRIDWSRFDFCGASLELLIGVIQTALCPDSSEEWEELWGKPPTPEILAQLLAPFAYAFNLNGDGPLFLQDIESLGDDRIPVGNLLIDQPGANTEKNNADLFVKRGQVGVMAASTAAMALFILQSSAPAGGAGHRTSMRGGGPLTTLVLPGEEPTLWQTIWMNVVPVFDPDNDGLPQDNLEKVFPWLTNTRVSDKAGRVTTPEDTHPLQYFWGMPRRIRLDFEANEQGLPCDITGQVEDVIVRSYRSRPFGVNYQQFIHPLTPYYSAKKDSELLATHPQPGGIAYRHWLSYVTNGEMRKQARCVVEAEKRIRELKGIEPRLLMFGYDMDNAKARGFVETEMPLFVVPDTVRETFYGFLRMLVDGAGEALSILSGTLGSAIGSRKGSRQPVREFFFQDTEQEFFDIADKGLKKLTANQADAAVALLALSEHWRAKVLLPNALRLFDNEVPVDGLVSACDPQTIRAGVTARATLIACLNGAGPSGKRLFKALNLALPQKKSVKTQEGTL